LQTRPSSGKKDHTHESAEEIIFSSSTGHFIKPAASLNK
jgi:hypothetical protein